MTGTVGCLGRRRDPRDRNIRLAPSFPEFGEVETAMAGVATCVALAAAERLADIG